jgi:RimJ/RimL family protein N-acetyltransferase
MTKTRSSKAISGQTLAVTVNSKTDAPITTERLLLVPMTVPFLEACLGGDAAAARTLLGSAVPAAWFAEAWLMRLRLGQLQQDSGLTPWLLRAIIRRDTNMMIGHIGFHGYPDAEALRDYAPGGAEMGYTIFPDQRRQGYAREAVAGLMAWATASHGVTQFVLSISPTNAPSRQIAHHFGFVQVGTVEDEEDGPEDLFVLKVGPAGT